MITDHEFEEGPTGYCIHRSPGERCGFSEMEHGGLVVEVPRFGGGLAQRDADPAGEKHRTARINAAVQAADPLKSHEATKRVLFHVVNSYQSWRNVNGMMPNELTDDAVRVGEQHLRDVEWFPADEGWLAEGAEQPGSTTKFGHLPSVIDLIDLELQRLGDPVEDYGKHLSGRKRQAWRDGLRAARTVAAIELRSIKKAYLAEQAARETEAKRTYGIKEH